MRYPASEKLEIIRLVDQSHLHAADVMREQRGNPITDNSSTARVVIER